MQSLGSWQRPAAGACGRVPHKRRSGPGTDHRWPLSRCRCPARSSSTPQNPSRWRGQCEGLSAKPGFRRREAPVSPPPAPRLSAFLSPSLTLVPSSRWDRYTAECTESPSEATGHQRSPPAGRRPGVAELGTGRPPQAPLLSALEVQHGGRTEATLRRGPEGPRLRRAQLPTVSFRLFKTTSPRGEPQDGLYCIRNSSTKTGKVGTGEGALAATLPSRGPGGGCAAGLPTRRADGRVQDLAIRRSRSRAGSYLASQLSAILGDSAWQPPSPSLLRNQMPSSDWGQWWPPSGTGRRTQEGRAGEEGEAAQGGRNGRISARSVSVSPRVTRVTSLSLSFPMCVRSGPGVDQAPVSVI